MGRRVRRHFSILASYLVFFFNSLSVGGGESNWVHSARRPLIGLLLPAPGDYDGEFMWNEDWQGKPKYS
jgi:hypothetical protein